MMEYKTELLAPAGNIDAFIGAIHAGADAVYLGGPKYGARAYAENFTEEELIACIRYAHIFGRKVYLTVNTLMKDTELDDLYRYLAPYYKAGLDAVIVQDIGVFQFIKEYFPQMELHVSTQMTITGIYGASLLKKLGATRIVPARELSLQEIINIKKQTGLEIETFIHGAMCYCYSGQCLFSSILGGRSGNRGRCAQPCRLSYSTNAAGKQMVDCYPLSLKDMCTLEHIGTLMDAGIDSFKIEGRMKKAEYAAGVTAIYRKYIDLKKKYPNKDIIIDKKDAEDITKLYIRSERQDGYYFKQNGAEMVTLDCPAYSGSDERFLQSIREKYINTPLKKNISVYGSFFCGEEVTLTLICDNAAITVTGDIMEPAQNQPISEEMIRKQLCKLGDTCFETEAIEISTDNLGFCPVKKLNELRRNAIKELENALIIANGFDADRLCETVTRTIFDNNKEPAKYLNGWSVLVSSPSQLDIICAYPNPQNKISCIYIESDILLNKPNQNLPKNIDHIYVALPYILRNKDLAKMREIIDIASKRPQIKGMLVRNYEEYEYLKSISYSGSIVTDAGVYVWNHSAYEFWENKVQRITCPIELNQYEWTSLFKNRPVEKIVYGRLPMMITANCISKTSGCCLHGQDFSVGWLSDRYKKKFPVMLQCKYCYNILLNSVPLSLHGKEQRKWYDKVQKRLVFTIENGNETKRILDYFLRSENDTSLQLPYQEYTTGHEKRGVE